MRAAVNATASAIDLPTSATETTHRDRDRQPMVPQRKSLAASVSLHNGARMVHGCIEFAAAGRCRSWALHE